MWGGLGYESEVCHAYRQYVGTIQPSLVPRLLPPSTEEGVRVQERGGGLGMRLGLALL